MRYLIPTASLVLLAACGGGTTEPTPPPGFADPDSTVTSTLSAASLFSLDLDTSTQSGTLNRSADRYSVGDIAGDINDARSEVAIDGGGRVTFDAGNNTFSVRFDATPQGDDRVIGIVGIPTAAGALPTTGSVNYSGDSNVTIQDDLTEYELSGEAVVVANFGTDRVTTTIDDLSGERTIGAGNASAVSDVGTIVFSDSVLTGATFTGGTVVVNSAELSNLSADAVSSLDGVVYGPNGEEIGGVFIVNDAATSGVTILGDFLAAD